MHIRCTGLSHHTAPVGVREWVAFAGERLPRALNELLALSGVSQVVVLSTCNRTEIYTVSATDISRLVPAWLGSQSQAKEADLSPHLYELTGREAATHICCVAAGIDSQLLGESEVLGQVKAAMKAASEAGALGPELGRLFSVAVKAGKRVRSATAIGRGAFSMGRCAVEKARAALGSLSGRAVLLLGAGKIAESTAKHLREQGAETVLVANRTYSRAEEVARQLGGRALRYDQIAQALLEADVVISSTSAPHFVLLSEQIAEAMSCRGDRELFLIDIAVPRDIDPQAADIPGVHLYDIDDLGSGLEQAAACRATVLEQARAIAEEGADEFCEWLAAREAIPILGALRARFEDVRQEQLSKFAGRLKRLAPGDRQLVDALTVSLTKRLLHEPMVNLKRELAIGNGKAAETLVSMYALAPGENDRHTVRSRLEEA